MYNFNIDFFSWFIFFFFHAYPTNGLPWYVVYSDILSYGYEKVIEPGFPYINKVVDYPVLTGLFIQSTNFFGEKWYYLLNSLGLIFFAIISTYFLYKIAEDKKRIYLFWTFAPSMVLFLILNWDMLTIFFVVLAFYFINKNKDYIAVVFLALGFSAKFYPVIYILPLLFKKRKIDGWLKIVIIFGLTTFLINIFFILVNFQGWFHFYKFNSLRLPNPDSIWGLISHLIPQLSVTNINFISGFLFISISLFFLWRFRKESVTKLCFIITLIFLLTSKVFSPQYLLWLLPFFVLLPITNKKEFYSLEISNALVLFLALPYLLIEPPNLTYLYLTQIFAVLRHIILLYLLVKIIRY